VAFSFESSDPGFEEKYPSAQRHLPVRSSQLEGPNFSVQFALEKQKNGAQLSATKEGKTKT